MKRALLSKHIRQLVLLGALFAVPMAFAFADENISVTISNPIAAGSLYCFLYDILNIVLTIAVIVAAFFIIYAGFLLVTAGGDESKLKDGKHALLGALIGTALILGTWVIEKAIVATVDAIRGGTPTQLPNCS